MNCPSKTDPVVSDGFNQNPNALSADLTTNNDLARIASLRLQHNHRLKDLDILYMEPKPSRESQENAVRHRGSSEKESGGTMVKPQEDTGEKMLQDTVGSGVEEQPDPDDRHSGAPFWKRSLKGVARVVKRYAKFVGPGFMISVAYIDPGNYATDVAGGASYRFKLLFMILLSNLFAIFLQSLCIRLGTVTGMNLAEMCKAHFPRWLNYTLYVFAEAAIIATDIAEVIGTAIALNLLCNKIPLVAGCAISIIDVLFILLFWQPDGGTSPRPHSCKVAGKAPFSLHELTYVVANEVDSLYQACGILGATVMPHSLYLGSGIIQPRLKEFDVQHNTVTPPRSVHSMTEDLETESLVDNNYHPSIAAIRSCMTYSIVELSFSLFTFALFVNSAILIVAGASLYGIPGSDNADLFGIHRLLSDQLAPAAGTIFALALLLSGTSAGIVCTIAGQMVSEGQLDVRVKPWVRRLMTRSISITPSIIIAGAVGANGLSVALEASQVALSIILPFTAAPLIYFTAKNKFMTAKNGRGCGQGVKMRNHWFVTALAIAIWLLISVMDVAAVVLLGLGVDLIRAPIFQYQLSRLLSRVQHRLSVTHQRLRHHFMLLCLDIEAASMMLVSAGDAAYLAFMHTTARLLSSSFPTHVQVFLASHLRLYIQDAFDFLVHEWCQLHFDSVSLHPSVRWQSDAVHVTRQTRIWTYSRPREVWYDICAHFLVVNLVPAVLRMLAHRSGAIALVEIMRTLFSRQGKTTKSPLESWGRMHEGLMRRW
nr:manganese transporter smf1 [Quercus suber]